MSFWKKILTKEVSDLLGIAGTIGLHMVSGTFVGLAIGYFLDQWLGTKPWLTLFMLVVGVAAGFKNVYDDARRIQRQHQAENPGPPHLAEARRREGADDSVKLDGKNQDDKDTSIAKSR